MRRFRTLFHIAWLFLAITTHVSAQQSTETTVTMSDGVVLDALYFRPTTQAPANGYPAILLVHGFAGSKNDVRTLARTFATQGYVTVGYSVRGQGASGGLFDFFSSERILGDLRAMIDYTAHQPQVNPDRVAVLGGSQGGLHAWFAAAYQMPVRTVVSIIANGRVRENWLENNAMNWMFSHVALTSGVRFDQGTLTMIQQAGQTGQYDSLRSFLTRYSSNERELDVKVPVAIIVSAHDIFFNQNAAIRQFANLPTASRFILYPGGHALPEVQEQENYVLDVIDRWLAWWLKDDVSSESVASPDSAVVHFDGATGERRVFARADEGLWLAPDPGRSELGELNLYFSNLGMLEDKPVNAGSSAVRFTTLLGSQPAVFRSEPFTRDVTLAPFSPLVSMYCSATGGSYQMNVSLFDYDPSANARTPIGRGHMQVDGNTGGTQLLQFELTRILHTMRAGHSLEVQVHGGVSFFPDFGLNFGNIVTAPAFNSENSLLWGGDAASTLRLYTLASPVTDVTVVPSLPRGIAIGPNYPNPFGTSTFIPLAIATTQHVRVRMFSSTGREVATLYDGVLEAGSHALMFKADNLPSGIYFCRAESGIQVVQRQVLLLR